MLKAKDRWPTTARVFCQQVDEAWPGDAEIVDDLAVATCRRRGVADLLARVRVRYPAVAIVFAGSRKHGEEYTFRFLGGRPSGARLGPGRRAD